MHLKCRWRTAGDSSELARGVRRCWRPVAPRGTVLRADVRACAAGAATWSLRGLAAVAVLALLTASLAWAQGGSSAADGAASSVEEAPPALLAVGLSGGFPSYQTAALAVSLQAQYVGIQVKGSWTPAGPFVGVQLRGYPPVPVPVPLYVGVGAGIYGANTSWHAALGAHVPLGRATRLDVEGGVASVPLLEGRAWAPHVAVGVSYAFALPSERGSAAAAGEQDPRANRDNQGVPRTCAEAARPDEVALMNAFRLTLQRWIDSARATYGSVYTDLRYDVDVTSTTLEGNDATVRLRYRGSVREIATGLRHEAEGEASATFRWSGCAWRNTGVAY